MLIVITNTKGEIIFVLPNTSESSKIGLWFKRSNFVATFHLGRSPLHSLQTIIQMELAERRARLEEEAARKIAEKEMKPKKPRPAPKTDWVVLCIKGMKIAQEKTWYQVNLLPMALAPLLLSCLC